MTQIEAHGVHRFKPVGECIYCGKTSRLSDEHIIPFGLTRNMVLPEASCGDCSAMTSRIELRVLRGFMFDARTVAKMPTRRKKERPLFIKTTFISADDSIVEKDVPVAEAAAFLTLPTFPRAGILSGEALRNGISVVGDETLSFGKHPDEVAKKHGAKGLRIESKIAVADFTRFLAKIAYGYYVAVQGLFPREETPLLRLMMGEETCLGCWVGSATYTLAIEEKRPIHALGVMPIGDGKGGSGALVRVKLFADSGATGATGYEIATRVPGWQSATAHARQRGITRED